MPLPHFGQQFLYYYKKSKTFIHKHPHIDNRFIISIGGIMHKKLRVDKCALAVLIKISYNENYSLSSIKNVDTLLTNPSFKEAYEEALLDVEIEIENIKKLSLEELFNASKSQENIRKYKL